MEKKKKKERRDAPITYTKMSNQKFSYENTEKMYNFLGVQKVEYFAYFR